MSILARAREKLAATKRPVTLLVTEQPLLSSVHALFPAERPVTVRSFPQTKEQFSQLQAQLLQSFLGQTDRFLLFMPHQTSKALKKDVYTFLSRYEGPHTLYIIIAAEDQKLLLGGDCERVMLPAELSPRDIQLLAEIISFERAAHNLFLIPELLKQGSFSLDQAFSLLLYLELMPGKKNKKAVAYITKLFPEAGSLYALSDAFWFKNKKQFFELWDSLYDDYSEVFWVSYWANLLWRSYFYILFQKNNQREKARTIGYRLSQKLTRETWKQVDCDKLFQLYSEVARFDSALKTGSALSLRDLFLGRDLW